MITDSLDAQEKVYLLEKQAGPIKNKELKKLIHNLNKMVDNLAQNEVVARQNNATRSAAVENSKQRLEEALQVAETLVVFGLLLS